MRVKHRFAFNVESDSKLLDFIIDRKLKFKPAIGKSSIAVIYIFEDQKEWLDLKKIADECNCSPITTCEFSKEEYKDASWFVVRTPKCILYPQPENGYIDLTFDRNSYCINCGSNKSQLSEFRLKGVPKWGKNNFFTLNWIYDQIFINENVYDQFTNSGLTGFEFIDVRSYKSDKILKGIKQIQVINKIPRGLIEDRMTFKKVYTCTTCNTKKYILHGSSQLIFEKEVFEIDADIVRSSETFGDGLVATHLIFISKKFYNFIKENGWDKELEVKPVRII